MDVNKAVCDICVYPQLLTELSVVRL